MNRLVLATIASSALLLLAFAGASSKSASEPVAAPPSLVREARTIAIGGTPEEWRLVWRDKPQPICQAQDIVDAATCPCEGVAYGEYGQLALQRRQAGRVTDSLPLGPLFGGFAGDFDGHGGVPEGMIALRRKALERPDYQLGESSPDKLAAVVAGRPDTVVMQFADYDHDGNASEFLLDVGTLPCGKLQFVAVGVSRDNPRLHAFGSAAHPDRPLAMPLQAWQALLEAGEPQRIVSWECGDHGSEFHTELELSAADGRISAKQLSFACPVSPGGPPQETEVL